MSHKYLNVSAKIIEQFMSQTYCYVTPQTIPLCCALIIYVVY
jgi:hypothetical protein